MPSERETVQQKYVTVQTASQFSSLCPGTIRKLMDEGRLRRFKPVSGRVLVDLDELRQLIEASAVPA
jgi:hypothetical protein